MKLSTKEIAQRLRLSVRGVETGRYRLRKKLGMKDGEHFAAFLETV
jgi:DNA-binding CsgD family transcriptional regulator